MEEQTLVTPVEPYNLLNDYANEEAQFRALNTYITTYIMYLAAQGAFKNWETEDDTVSDMVIVCENIYDSLSLFIAFLDISLNHIENYLKEGEDKDKDKKETLRTITRIREEVITAIRDKLSYRNQVLTKVIAPLAMTALKTTKEITGKGD